MANLAESSTFDAGVYQIELTDPVIGGPSGVTNAPLKNLANRTKYLKDHVDALESTRAPIANPEFTGTPKVPTAAVGTNSTQAASTAFVKSEMAANPGTPASHVGATGSAHGVATESVAGFMSAADKAALDDLIAGFDVSKATAGYQRLPSGLIVQWGLSPTITTTSSYVTFSFPIAFPTVCLLLTGGPEGGAVSNASSISAFSIVSKTTGRMDGWGGAAMFRGAYIAIGY